MQHGFGARPSIKKISANRRASVGAAAMTKMIKIPSNAKTVEIGQKPKRGQPAVTKKVSKHQPALAAPTPVAPTSVQPIKSTIAVTKRKTTDESQTKPAKHAKLNFFYYINQ